VGLTGIVIQDMHSRDKGIDKIYINITFNPDIIDENIQEKSDEVAPRELLGLYLSKERLKRS
jgi:hypothetical protein